MVICERPPRRIYSGQARTACRIKQANGNLGTPVVRRICKLNLPHVPHRLACLPQPQRKHARQSGAIGLAQRGEVDACVGGYRDEVSDLLYPRWNYDTDHIYALGLASNPAPTPETLGNYRLAWVRGYDFQNYLPNVNRYNEVVRRTGILSMLTHNRADYYIDALTEVDYVLRRAKDPTHFRRTHIAELPLYLCFANNPKARKLMAVFDQRMEVLVKNGRLKPIFERWKQPYPIYSN